MADEIKKWICPNDGTYNGGNFCIRCGLRRPEETRPEERIPVLPLEPEEESILVLPEETADAEAEKITEGSDDAAEAPEGTEAADQPEETDDPAESGEKRGVRGLLSDTTERIGELCGDAAAYVSRTELVQSIKKDKTSRRIFIAGAVGVLLLLFLLFALLLAPRMGICILFHRYAEASCTSPMTCVICGRQKGEPIDHDFAPASCTEPALCRVCGTPEGEALGHRWVEADCNRAKYCSVCGVTEGEKREHTPGETVVRSAPTVLEPGCEDVCCALCGQVIEQRATYLDSYAQDDGFAFSVTEYAKLFLKIKEEYAPELSFLVLPDEKTGADSFSFFVDTDKLASCVLYDHGVKPIKIDDAGDMKPYVVRWSFEKPGNADHVRAGLSLALFTLSPSPVDTDTLLKEKDMAVGGLRYIFENDGNKRCRLTVINMNACSDDAVSELLYAD